MTTTGSVGANVSAVRRMARDMGRSQYRLVPAVTAVVAKGALNIKTDWRQRWSGLSHAPALASAITYDMTVGVGTIGAEIGPDKAKRQGALGNLIEFGSRNNAPRPGGGPALNTEQPKFEAALAAVLVKSLIG